MDGLLEYLGPLLPALTPWAYALALALARVAGIMLALPQLIGNKVPAQIKATVAVAIASSLVFIGSPPVQIVTAPRPELALVVAALGEFCFGLALGFFVHLGLAAVRFAGEMIGMEMGLSFAAVVDPTSQENSTPISQLLGQIGVQMFLVLGLDRDVIRALALSVKQRPLGQASLDGAMAFDLTGLGDGLFRLGVQLAIPIVGTVFALKLAMAMLARVTPKIQIFTLSFTLSILLGLLALGAAFPSLAAAIAEHLTGVAAALRDFATTPVAPATPAAP